MESAPKLILTVIITTVCWLIAAYFAPQTDRHTLIDFYKKVHPAGPGWEVIRKEAGVSKETARLHGDNIPMALLGWVSGCAMTWSALFTLGNFLYGRNDYGFGLLIVFIVSSLTLLKVVSRLWAANSSGAIDQTANAGE